MNKLISNKSTFYSFGRGFLLVHVWWVPETSVPADFPLWGTRPNSILCWQPRPTVGRRDWKAFPWGRHSLPYPKQSSFFFFPGWASFIWNTEWPEEGHGSKKGLGVLRVGGGWQWCSSGWTLMFGKKKREAAESGMVASGCFYFMWAAITRWMNLYFFGTSISWVLASVFF